MLILKNQVKAIAIPPPRGVGIVCELLSFGKSNINFLIAILRTI